MAVKTPEKGLMNITIHVSDSLAEQAKIGDLVHYLSQMADDTLQKVVEQNQQTEAKPSKWAQVADEAANLRISAETWEHINACREEFRADEGV